MASHRCIYCGLRTEGAIECADEGASASRCVRTDPTADAALLDAVLALRPLADQWRREDRALRRGDAEHALTRDDLLGRMF